MSESVFPYTLPCGAVVIDERVLIQWPESQRIMEHPRAVLELDVDTYSPCAYWVPANVWERYKDGYYECEHLDYATDLDGNYCLGCGLRETDSPNEREGDIE